VVDDGAEMARDVMETAGQALGFAREIMIHPMRSAEKAMTTARGTVGLLQDLGKRKIADPIADGAAGMARRMDRMSVSLEDLRRVHKAIGATINDLVLTAVSGAVGRYHVRRGLPVETLRAMVPMNLRVDRERNTLGNRIGFLNISLPVGEKDPRRRLAIIQQDTGRAKRDRRGAIYPYLARFVTAMPTFVFRAVVAGTAGNVNLICTNVPGTPETRWISGRRIKAIIPFAPIMEKCPMSVALFSYTDQLCVGLATDPEAIPDHARLKKDLEDAFKEVLGLDARPRGRGKKAR
jgi:WS/DGAT/MGAT family acyltransferase